MRCLFLRSGFFQRGWVGEFVGIIAAELCCQLCVDEIAISGSGEVAIRREFPVFGFEDQSGFDGSVVDS